jgi:hypothetical protein
LPATFFHAVILICLFVDPEDGGYMFLRDVGVTFRRMHAVVSHKIVFITTAENLKSNK